MELKNPLLRRAVLYLEDKEWGKADDYCEQVLDQEPENAEAYVIKLMARLKVDKIESIGLTELAYEQWNSYQKAYRFADEDLKKQLEELVQKAKTCAQEAEQRRKEEQEAQRKAAQDRRRRELYNEGRLASGEKATLEGLKRAQRCFAQILDYSDARERKEACENRIVKLESERNFQVYQQIEQERKRKRKIWGMTALVLLCAVIGLALWILGLQESSQKKADQIEKNLANAVFCGTETDNVVANGGSMGFVTEMTQYTRTFRFDDDGTVTVLTKKLYDKEPFITKNGERQWDITEEYTTQEQWGNVKVSIWGKATIEIGGVTYELTMNDNNIPISFKLGKVTYKAL